VGEVARVPSRGLRIPSEFLRASIRGGRSHVDDEDVEAAEADRGLSDREIHDRDVAWLREADRAVEWGKPVCCLYRPDGDHALSAMVRGNDAVTVEEYRDPADVEATLAAFVERHG